MAWNPNAIAGLASINNQQEFDYRSNQIVPAGGGGDFSYDDTAWGNVPKGLFNTLATCAVNPDPPPTGTWYSGKYVQLLLGFIASMHGYVTAFNLSMHGLGALRVANWTDGSDFAASLPLAFSGYVYLLRPTTLSWLGQDSSNDANKTIWLQSEIDVVTFGFSVGSITQLNSQVAFIAQGWTTP